MDEISFSNIDLYFSLLFSLKLIVYQGFLYLNLYCCDGLHLEDKYRYFKNLTVRKDKRTLWPYERKYITWMSKEAFHY